MTRLTCDLYRQGQYMTCQQRKDLFKLDWPAESQSYEYANMALKCKLFSTLLYKRKNDRFLNKNTAMNGQ